jgi:hypothetical protein
MNLLNVTKNVREVINKNVLLYLMVVNKNLLIRNLNNVWLKLNAKWLSNLVKKFIKLQNYLMVVLYTNPSNVFESSPHLKGLYKEQPLGNFVTL